MATYTEAQILAIGGTLWEKNGQRRVYLNDIAGIYRAGHRAEFDQAEAVRAGYGTGGYRYDAPSNRRLRDVRGDIRGLYLDCATGHLAGVAGSEFGDTIEAGIAALVAGVPAA